MIERRLFQIVLKLYFIYNATLHCQKIQPVSLFLKETCATLAREFKFQSSRVAQLVEHRVVMREVVSSTPAGPSLRVLK